MDSKYFSCLLKILSTFSIVQSTIILQNNKRVLAPVDTIGVHILLIKEKSGLLQISNSNYEVTGEFEHGADALSVDYHYLHDRLYWTTRSGHVYSCNLKKSRLLAYVNNPELVYTEERWLPASLAVDYITDRLYVLDTRSNSIRILGLHYDKQTTLSVAEREFKPVMIELDAREKYVFLMDRGEFGRNKVNHILRMNMDGSEPKVIDPPSLSGEIITGRMTVDRLNKIVLVSSTYQRKIFAIDYNGNMLNTIHEQNGAISMSVTRNELFWVNSFNYHDNTVASDGRAYLCDYDGKIGCKANATYRRLPEDGIILAIRAVEPDSQINTNQTANTCQKKNYCAHDELCFDIGKSNVSCACEIGWQLGNNVSCRSADEFLLYEDNGIVRGACLEGKCQPIIPFLTEIKFKNGERTGFDYDPTTRKLYYGGKDAIYQVDIDTGAKARILHQRSVFFGPLVLDWMAKNLYYVEIEQRGNVSFYIMKVITVRSGEFKLAQASSTLLWEFGGVHTMSAHPQRGYLFTSVFNNVKRRFHLLRLQTDAKNATYLMKLENTTFVSIDYPKDRLYVVNSNTGKIMSSNLNGEDVREIGTVKNLGSDLTGFLVHKNLIYIQNRTSLRKFDKSSGKDLGELDLFPYDIKMLAGLKLHSIETFKNKSEQNACAENNGGCDNFCFAIPRNNSTEILKTVCRCFDGIKCKGLGGKSG